MKKGNKKKVNKSNNKAGRPAYYKLLDTLRLFSCVAVLLYHLNILKGGYLAVCSFFVLSGYLSCKSAFKKKKFSFLEYYKDRFKNIYIPLILVLFIATGITLKLEVFTWINLKKEIISNVLLYNNFWQLSANLDYFTRSIASPFTHLWYISILIQYEILFPILFILLKKLGEKTHKIVAISIPIILGNASFVFFCRHIVSNTMFSYYNPFTRVFALLFGIGLGFLNNYYKVHIPTKVKKKKLNKKIFYGYLLVLALLFIFIGNTNKILMPIAMFLTCLITVRLIDYATEKSNRKLLLKDKIVKKLASVSYEVYLIQYPVIFLLQYTPYNTFIKILLAIFITFILSYIMNFALKQKYKYIVIKILKILLKIILLALCIFGIWQYITARDYSKELKDLENQLNENEDLMKEKQEEYERNYQKQKEELEQRLRDIEKGESELNTLIPNLHVVGIGDSVLLGAVPKLYEQFPNGYFDGKISRTAWSVKDIVEELKEKNQLGDPIILNLGANGDCSGEFRKEIMKAIGDKEVFWLTVTNDEDVNFNAKIKAFAEEYKNLHIIDWEAISKDHPEYFYADGIHLTGDGVTAYIKAIYDAIYVLYDEQFTIKKEEVIKEHETNLKNNITFYGNDTILNISNLLQKDYDEAKFIIEKDYDYDKLIKSIDDTIANNTITNKIVIALDKEADLSEEDYSTLITKLNKQTIYIVILDEETKDMVKDIKNQNVILIDFYKILNNDDNLMIDNKQLSNDGKEELRKAINKSLN